MWTFATMLFYSAMQNSSKTWQKGDKKLTKSRQSISSKTICSNTSSKTFAPMINSHVDSQLFKPAPNFNQPLLRRWCGFSSGIHDAAWQLRSRNQLNWDLDCLEATNLEKWSRVFLDAQTSQFHEHNLQVWPWTVTLVLVLQGNVATKLSYGGQFFILVMSRFFLILILKEF